MAGKKSTGGYHPYTPPARTAEDDRTLLNWLSTRVAANGLDPDPDTGFLVERKMVEHRIAYAHALGLKIQPGVYLPPNSLTHTPRQLDYATFLSAHTRNKHER